MIMRPVRAFFVFFRFLRLYPPVFFRFFLPEKQALAALQCRRPSPAATKTDCPQISPIDTEFQKAKSKK